MAPVVFVQPKRAWSNHFLSSLYLLFQTHQFFFLKLSSFFMFYLCPTLEFIRNTSPKLSYGFYKGVGPEQDFNILQKFLNHCVLYRNVCVIIPIFPSVVLLLLNCIFLGKKNILHDPTVFPELLYIPFVNTLWLYSTVPIYYWQLHGTVCVSRTIRTLTHTHKHTESLITSPIL